MSDNETNETNDSKDRKDTKKTKKTKEMARTKCSDCSKNFAGSQALREHERTHHLGGVCYYPGSSFPDFEGEDDLKMTKQLLEANDNNGGSEEGGSYVCRWGCASGTHTYKSLATLKFHLRQKQKVAMKQRQAQEAGADVDSEAIIDPEDEVVAEAGSSAQDDAAGSKKDGCCKKGSCRKGDAGPKDIDSDGVSSKSAEPKDADSKGADSEDDASVTTTEPKTKTSWKTKIGNLVNK
ncbi:hypothetical protein Hte_007111 [Hypoxylon texense]